MAGRQTSRKRVGRAKPATRGPGDAGRAFDFLELNRRDTKPRERGVTEIRGPYYTVLGRNYLADLFATVGAYVDSLEFAGGSFALMPRAELRRIVDLCHEHGALVSTGGFVEHVLAKDPGLVRRYVEECREVGFDIVELSAGFLTLPTDDWLRLIEEVQRAGLRAKPEVGIQFGAGGDTPRQALEREGTGDPGYAVARARRFLEAGAYMVMVESEGVTENADPWRTDVPAAFVEQLGLEKVMFEAADPEVFAWYVRNYGPEVNLFVDHSQVVQLECLRSGLWGTQSLWGRVVTYKP